MPQDITEGTKQNSAESLPVYADYYSVRVGADRFLHLRPRSGERANSAKVMLWVLASLLMLVEDVFSADDSKQASSDLWRVFSQTSSFPTEEVKKDSSMHPNWPDVAEDWSKMQEEEIQQSRWRRSSDPNFSRASRGIQKKIKSSHDCRLLKKEMRVRDLGLGYDSDEIVLFKYCVGTCASSRKNYDLVLGALVANKGISSKKVSGHPCCRPTRYETVSFMDSQTTWQTIKWLSAASCSCMG